jgi:hypothetical protein
MSVAPELHSDPLLLPVGHLKAAIHFPFPVTACICLSVLPLFTISAFTDQ